MTIHIERFGDQNLRAHLIEMLATRAFVPFFLIDLPRLNNIYCLN